MRESVYGKRRDQKKHRDGIAEQRALNELVKLIHKLRWIGLEEDATRLENELTLRRVAAGAYSVVVAPRETD